LIQKFTSRMAVLCVLPGLRLSPQPQRSVQPSRSLGTAPSPIPQPGHRTAALDIEHWSEPRNRLWPKLLGFL